MGEKPPPVRNLSRNLRAMKFMRRGENHLDLEAEAVNLKTKPEQWFREVEPIEEKKLGNDASMVECMDLRWGRASFGGFNKTVEKLSTRMNSALPDDDELAEEEDVYGVAERLRSIREGTYKTEQDESSESEPETFDEKKPAFKRPK